jgi:hypothetical protein
MKNTVLLHITIHVFKHFVRDAEKLHRRVQLLLCFDYSHLNYFNKIPLNKYDLILINL